jgi:hypothetical protein
VTYIIKSKDINAFGITINPHVFKIISWFLQVRFKTFSEVRIYSCYLLILKFYEVRFKIFIEITTDF